MFVSKGTRVLRSSKEVPSFSSPSFFFTYPVYLNINSFTSGIPNHITLQFQVPIGAPFVGTFPSTYKFGQEKFPQVPEIFAPQLHVNFENAMQPASFKNDGLVKMKDFPTAFGGSGVVMFAS